MARGHSQQISISKNSSSTDDFKDVHIEIGLKPVTDLFKLWKQPGCIKLRYNITKILTVLVITIY